MSRHSNDNKRKAFFLLLAAALVFFVLSQFQLGRLILWPFIVVTTFIHELGHGLAAILLGGDLHKIEIHTNASGLARFSGISSGLPLALVALAGLIAPSLAGAAFITCAKSKQASSALMLGLSLLIFMSCLLWVRTVFGLITLILFAIFFTLLARRSANLMHQFAMQFMGVHMLVDTFTRTLRYLFTASTSIDGQAHHSDTGVIAANLGGSYLLWAFIVAVFSIGILGYSLRQTYFKNL